MITYFGTGLREKPDGMKLTRENYIKIDNRNSFIGGLTYSEQECNEYVKNALKNYDLNMRYFKSLDKQEFEKAIDNFISKHPRFKEVSDLEFKGILRLAKGQDVPGYYIMILGEYCQAYFGTSDEIKKRIKSHWTKTMPLDRLIFGSVSDSILSIDSFRAFDTTKIFVYATNQTFDNENDFIENFPSKFCLNRTVGGLLSGGLLEATMNIKTRQIQ